MRWTVRLLAVALLCATLTPARGADEAATLRRLTPRQQEQIQRGAADLAQAGRAAGVPSVHVPALAMSDASTPVATPEMVAASWDAGAAHDYGTALAQQALEQGTNVVAVPIDAFGEDPLLAAHLAAPLVRGMESAHAIAALFGGASGLSDPRAVHELEWPALESGIVKGKAGAVTCALRDGRTSNLCSGRQIAELLSREVRFDGFGIAMPAAGLSAAPRVLNAIRHAHLTSVTTVPPQSSQATLSRRLVERGSVLLKNDAGVLPLDPQSVASLAVIGADEQTADALRGALPQTRIATAVLDDTAAAVQAAQGQAACIIVVGPQALPNEADAIAQVEAVNPRTAVVVERKLTEAPAWTAATPALLLTWAPVVGTPSAVANLLTGVVAPSGRLPVTLPVAGTQLPAQGLRRGYRAYAAANVVPAFPFGAGLTYTQFSYSGLRVAYGHGRGAPVTVSFTVRNDGDRSGTMVPQLYLEYPPASDEPSKVLADFARVTLAPGAQRLVSMPLSARSFAYWSTAYKAWFVAPGTYRASVGRSVADVALAGDIQIVAR